MVDIFTDGGAWNNGKSDCKAGYGVYIPSKNIRVSEKYTDRPSNQRAELMGIKKGIEITEETEIKIYTDSMYSINCLTKWCKNWEKNGWKNSKREEVKNQEIIKEILEMMKEKRIEFVHVRSHQRIPRNKETQEYYEWYGNNEADELANRALG